MRLQLLQLDLVAGWEGLFVAVEAVVPEDQEEEVYPDIRILPLVGDQMFILIRIRLRSSHHSSTPSLGDTEALASSLRSR